MWSLFTNRSDVIVDPEEQQHIRVPVSVLAHTLRRCPNLPKNPTATFPGCGTGSGLPPSSARLDVERMPVEREFRHAPDDPVFRSRAPNPREQSTRELSQFVRRGILSALSEDLPITPRQTRIWMSISIYFGQLHAFPATETLGVEGRANDLS